MKFGRKSQFHFSFHGQKIGVVNNYKYLGNIISGKKIIRLGGLPTESMLYIFQTIIAPILTYGSDVWGISKSAKVSADRMFLKCAKSALGVKYNTSNVMVYGECGTFPPIVTCDINVICFYNRLKKMSSNRLARVVLNELEYLHHNGFRTWVTDVLHLSQTYGVENFDMDCNSFKTHSKELVPRKFNESWNCELNDLDKNPFLRMYKLIKTDFSMEPYLNITKEAKYRRSIT